MNINYRWMPPAAAAFAMIFAVAWAKDATPWPIHLLFALALLGCAGLAMMLHSQGRPPGR